MKVAVSITVIIFIIGMMARITLFGCFQSMLADVRRGCYEEPPMNDIILRYNDCKKLNIQINNMEAFVEKFLVNYKVCGLRLMELEQIANICEMLIVISAAITGMIFVGNLSMCYVCITPSVLAIVALNIMERISDAHTTNRVLIAEVVDFLENSGNVMVKKPTCITKKLSKEAATEFVKLSKSYARIQATVKETGTNTFDIGKKAL